MIPAERQKKILNLIQQKSIASISELTDLLNVSHMTIRRDIQKLEDDGKVVSVSGGVQLLERLSVEPTHDDKSQLFQPQKEAIGIYAAQMIPPNHTIYLDAGTTTLAIAHQLVDRSDLLIITNDFAIADFLMKYGKSELIHIGGSVNKSNRSSVGELAAQFLRNLSIDIAFISTSSWNLKGLTTPNENKIPVKKAIIQSSTKNVLVSDSSKYGKVATFLLFGLNTFDYIICDKELIEYAQDAINEMEVELILV
ncbi:DeoR/GlpR family DNA-binding transcription regulator [Conservatibacter flavescens]|uniref:DeoR family transcriptional regulator n=1 Tax=Conservatibacter flavescens TaxID=28161 RepID=A0A2M8S4N5_9PAST|nr:DeoR/GlpR family DNA-binding transcription regulator [Conservatibacter flavescens]PJG86106.1 DeoR family transcriptional regulator [Conservatibacter flavescens]